MGDTNKNNIVSLLDKAAETHHTVYQKENGTDADWASWYANWLIDHSTLPTELGTIPVRSELIYLLVKLDKGYNKDTKRTSWQEYYAHAITEYFS